MSRGSLRRDSSFASLPVVAIIPAAGHATRLTDRAASKELIRVGSADGSKHTPMAQRPVIACLLDGLGEAGIRDVVLVLRKGKWDILDCLANQEWDAFNFRYVVTRGTPDVPHTVSLALPLARHAVVILGFPDILFRPGDALKRMLLTLRTSDADVILGLFPTDTPSKMDMINLGECNRIIGFDIKPSFTNSQYTWILAIWTCRFSEFLYTCLGSRPLVQLKAGESGELHLGDVFQAALQQGMRFQAEVFAKGFALDIGTPEDLLRAADWRSD